MISIIIPTLNEERFIGDTIAKLRGRFSIPHEIIVSDGGSRDATADVARRAGADKVIVWPGPGRQTIARGRNDGAAAAHGDFFVFLDADCTIPEPDRFFPSIIRHFERDSELMAVNVAIRVEPAHETWADWAIYNVFNDYLWLMNNVIHTGMAAGEFQMIRADAFRKAGGYDPSLVAAEDMDLFARLEGMGRVRYEKGHVVYHTGRRAHKVGWPHLLSLWILNFIFMKLTGHSYSKAWGGEMTS